MNNTEEIEKYKKAFDKCLNKNHTIKALVLKGWFVEWLVIGIIIWQFFVIYKMYQILTVIIEIQRETALATGQLFIVP